MMPRRYGDQWKNNQVRVTACIELLEKPSVR
jgi:hypothetical protein